MTVTVDFQWIFSSIGTFVCIGAPIVILLGMYVNYGVHRKGDKGEKWE